MFGNYVVFTGFFNRIVHFHVIVQGQHVAGNGTTHNSGMCGKGSGNGNLHGFQVQQAHTGHPLVELCHTFVMGSQVKPHKTLYDDPGCIPEQCGFNVIPLSTDGIQFVFFPELGKDFVFS